MLNPLPDLHDEVPSMRQHGNQAKSGRQIQVRELRLEIVIPDDRPFNDRSHCSYARLSFGEPKRTESQPTK